MKTLKIYKPATQGRKPLHPWDRWLDGKIYRLTSPTDFTCKPTSLANTIRKVAASRNLAVRVHIESATTIVINPSRDIL